MVGMDPPRRVDQLGVIASTLCAIHCALTALLPGLFLALGLGSLMGHEAEWALTGVALALACLALVLGWRRHRSIAITAALGLGMAGLLLARWVEEAGVHGLGTGLAVVGGITLVISHVSNIRAARPRAAQPCEAGCPS